MARLDPIVDRATVHSEPSRQLRLRDALIQIVLQQHPDLPSIHLHTASRTVGKANTAARCTVSDKSKVRNFGLPQMGNLQSPPTSGCGARSNTRPSICVSSPTASRPPRRPFDISPNPTQSRQIPPNPRQPDLPAGAFCRDEFAADCAHRHLNYCEPPVPIRSPETFHISIGYGICVGFSRVRYCSGPQQPAPSGQLSLFGDLPVLISVAFDVVA